MVTAYAKEVGVPLANVDAAAYMFNYLAAFSLRKQSDGFYAIIIPYAPGTAVFLIDTANDHSHFRNALVHCYCEDSWRQFVKIPYAIFPLGPLLTRGPTLLVTGKNISWLQIPPEQFMQATMTKGMSESVAREFTETFQVLEEFGYYGPKDLAPGLTRLARLPKTKTWAEFVEANDWCTILNWNGKDRAE
ncbi:hypothetical protein FRB97_004033 [Tulasnella sp. 331]|nr:hypothetical protein FRB97_004033 [Tulasnella sp. 331]